MTRSMKCVLTLSCGLLAAAANAAPVEKALPSADGAPVCYARPKGAQAPSLDKSLLTNHGGGVITCPHVILLFWGPSFAAGGAQNAYATTLQAYRNQLGSTCEWRTTSLYGCTYPCNLGAGTPDAFDTSTPPTNVTDSTVRSHVTTYLSTHAFDNSGIYTVVIPSTSYSSSGSSTSCGGPSLAYCAYHGSYSTGGHTAKYIILPWPGCSGCRVSGWSNVQNAEHFLLHEAREAATDPVNGWWDNTTGEEADDKCAWSPPPYLDANGYAYQYEWSNAVGGCIRCPM
jgi:hypothetical protein